MPIIDPEAVQETGPSLVRFILPAQSRDTITFPDHY